MLYRMGQNDCFLGNFRLSHYPSEDFTICFFQKSPKVRPGWIAYRALIFIYFLLTFIYMMLPFGKNIDKDDVFKFPIFLTNWTYTVETFQFGLALYLTAKRYDNEKKEPPVFPMQSTPKCYRFYWILFTIALSSSVVVSVMFWLTVYDPDLFPANASNVILHALNSIFMVLDFFLVNFPVKFFHFYLPAVYGIIYVTFSVIYYLSGGRGVKGLLPIYKILDWRQPGKAIVVCFGCLFFLLVVHTFFFILSKLKFWTKKPDSDDL